MGSVNQNKDRNWLENPQQSIRNEEKFIESYANNTKLKSIKFSVYGFPPQLPCKIRRMKSATASSLGFYQHLQW